MKCEICSHAVYDGFEKCPECGKVFQNCPLCSRALLPEEYEALPKSTLLAEVRADVQKVDNFIEEDCFSVEICEAWERIRDKVSKHFNSEKENM